MSSLLVQSVRDVLTWLRREDGQDSMEYALLACLLSIAAVAGILLLGPQITSLYTTIASNLP